MLKCIQKLSITLLFLLFTANSSANSDVKVVTSIKPIHSLASYLMDGVGKPDLIVDGYASPHGFSMKPSHAKMLQNADLIFWVGEGMENFLEKPLNSIAKKAEKIELMETKKSNILDLDKIDVKILKDKLNFKKIDTQNKIYFNIIKKKEKLKLQNYHEITNYYDTSDNLINIYDIISLYYIFFYTSLNT